jgi:isoquinoline 1-oxidoreductase
MDELANLIGMDPLAFRLKNINDARLRAVFEQGAERFGWGKTKSTPERCFGLGGGFEKGGYMATFAEVGIDRATGEVRVKRVVMAWDSGPVINPNGLRNQLEGSVVQGLGGALFEAVHFEKGQVTNPRFSDYRVPRFTDAPQIDCVIINRKDVPPFGAGETAIMGIAPAIGNAIFAGTGTRLRAMPLAPEGVEASG